MKIAVYVIGKNAKYNYKHESFNVRKNAGIAVIIDVLKKAGYEIDYVSAINVINYDILLYSITSDCDWLPFIAERIKWPKGNYKVIVGGAGVLNVRPFLDYADYFVLGRGENVIENLINNINGFECENIINSKTFSIDKKYKIAQSAQYKNEIILEDGCVYQEGNLGCNHKCLFCAYTWHRKNVNKGTFEWDSLFTSMADKEKAMLDMHKYPESIDWQKLRTSAIDGFSERLRVKVKKKITREILREFFYKIFTVEKPRQVKLYNIVGYPTETFDDWFEFKEDLIESINGLSQREKQYGLALHSTPFRSMPATPMALMPVSKINYRGKIAEILSEGKYKGNIFHKDKVVYAFETMGTESLPTVMESMIMLRGCEGDAEDIEKLALSKKYKTLSMRSKEKTLLKYFNIDKLFGEYTIETLPTRYLETYANVYKIATELINGTT